MGLGCDSHKFEIDTLENECANVEGEQREVCIGKNANEWFAHQPQCKDEYLQKTLDLL